MITDEKIQCNQSKEFGETAVQPARFLGMGSHINGFPFLLCGKFTYFIEGRLIGIILGSLMTLSGDWNVIIKAREDTLNVEFLGKLYTLKITKANLMH